MTNKYRVKARKSGDSPDYEATFDSIADAKRHIAEKYALSENEKDELNKHGWVALDLAKDGADLCGIKVVKEKECD